MPTENDGSIEETSDQDDTADAGEMDQHEDDGGTTGEAANPYLLEPNFVLSLRGEWERGGVVEILQGDYLLDFFVLPPAKWTIFASLVAAAIDAPHWSDAYVPTKRLIKRLEEYDLVVVPTAQDIYRLIHGIRSKLAKSSVHKFTSSDLTGKQWAELLVENRHLGYRIGLPPSQLRLFIG